MTGYILCGILLLFFIFYSIHLNIIKEEEIKKIKENRINLFKQIIESQLKNDLDKLKKTQESVNKAYNNLNLINNEIEQKKLFNENLLKIREEEIKRLAAEKENQLKEKINQEVEEWSQSAQEAATLEFEDFVKKYRSAVETAYVNLDTLKEEVKDFQEKREVINQEILRQRAIEENQEFYRIQLSEESVRDISVLNEIKPRLSKIDLLNKLIYDNYIKKPTDEMIKRVLGGRAPCGIYKITRLKTGEVYIGKSTDIKARWSQHSKSAFHCGTISHSTLHTTMEKDGIENFIWELLEEVPKEKLSEREKYWIQFYGSQKYGLNEKVG